MRALALIVLCGCRSILGIEDVDVIGGPDQDGPNPPNDGAIVDGNFDAPVGCPVMFQTLANSGPRGHRYYASTVPGTWQQQRDFCVSVGSFLAFPDGSSAANAQLELSAIQTFATQNVWIGVSDSTIEAQFYTSLNAPASQVTVSLISNNSQQNDCATGQANELKLESCTNSHKGVCECVP